MTDLWLDSKYAWRLARRTPLTVAVIVGSLALGIAANTAVFSFVNAIQFKALPVADEATLVDVSEWSATELCAGCGVGTSYPGFLEWKARAAVLLVDGRLQGGGLHRLGRRGTGASRRLSGLVRAVSDDWASSHPSDGGIAPADESPSAPPVVVISDLLWRNRLGARADVIGRTLRIDGRVSTIVGVMPAGFRWPEFAAAVGSARLRTRRAGRAAIGRSRSSPVCAAVRTAGSARPRCAPSLPRRKLPTPRATPAGRRR